MNVAVPYELSERSSGVPLGAKTSKVSTNSKNNNLMGVLHTNKFTKPMTGPTSSFKNKMSFFNNQDLVATADAMNYQSARQDVRSST